MLSKQKVLQFNVTVNHMLAVAVLERVSEFGSVPSSTVLTKTPHFVEFIEKIALRCEFLNKVHTSVVVEESVHNKNVGVPNVALDFNFVAEHRLLFEINKLRFTDAFNGNDVLTLLFTRKINVTILPATQVSAEFKIIESPLLFCRKPNLERRLRGSAHCSLACDGSEMPSTKITERTSAGDV